VLDPRQNGVYVDATVGPGGHLEEILKYIGPRGVLIGIDRDDEALKMAGERLSDRRVVLKRGSFADIESIVHAEGISLVDGVLFDLGMSMLQLKSPDKGFSFASDGRLDMRMDRRQKLSAWDVVNRYHGKELERILREFGEERLSRKIARAITTRRQKKSIDTCSELSAIVEGVYGGRGRFHPATRTFQALRIEVNRELDQLRSGLEATSRLLKSNGRLCVISYHSLEDRIVKHFLAESSRNGLFRVITKKPLVPFADEIRSNPSSRSAKLRGAEKI
jgi:16S rRNA (cytosine1402-N4)-methyltransferase